MDFSRPRFPVHHQLLELTQTHVHPASDAIQLSSSVIIPFFCLQSFPASGSCPMSQFFTSGDQERVRKENYFWNPWPSGISSFPDSWERAYFRWLSGKENTFAMQETGVWSLSQEDSLEGGNGNPLQYFCLEDPTDREAWWATVHGVEKEMGMMTTTTGISGTGWVVRPVMKRRDTRVLCPWLFFSSLFFSWLLTLSPTHDAWNDFHDIPFSPVIHILLSVSKSDLPLLQGNLSLPLCPLELFTRTMTTCSPSRPWLQSTFHANIREITLNHK